MVRGVSHIIRRLEYSTRQACDGFNKGVPYHKDEYCQYAFASTRARREEEAELETTQEEDALLQGATVLSFGLRAPFLALLRSHSKAWISRLLARRHTPSYFRPQERIRGESAGEVSIHMPIFWCSIHMII